MLKKRGPFVFLYRAKPVDCQAALYMCSAHTPPPNVDDADLDRVMAVGVMGIMRVAVIVCQHQKRWRKKWPAERRAKDANGFCVVPFGRV